MTGFGHQTKCLAAAKQSECVFIDSERYHAAGQQCDLQCAFVCLQSVEAA